MGLKEFSERQRAKADAQREKADRLSAERHAKKIKGKPWWLSDVPEFMCEYDDVEDVNKELAQAAPLGWYIGDTEAEGQHINIGRTATGAVLTGGFSLLFGGSRSKGKRIINWKRSEDPVTATADDPAAVLTSLAALRDQGILSADEFEAKKAEILSRI